MARMKRRAFLKGLGAVAGGMYLNRAFSELRADDTACVLEGPFGTAEVDLEHPSLTRLCLRQGNGRLAVKQLLSEHASDFPAWAVGATSYFVDEKGRRYEARHSTEHRWEYDTYNKMLRIANIRPRTQAESALPCVEQWSLCITQDGHLRWEIHRQFEQDFKASYHGGPALFFNINPNTGRTKNTRVRLNPSANGVAVNWWVQEDQLVGESLEDYRTGGNEHWFPTNKSVTMRKGNGWAIFKLYTSFPHDQDMRIFGEGGHLYRRGMYVAFAEIGMTTGPAAGYSFSLGQETQLAMEVEPVPQLNSGHQLMVMIPEKSMERNLKHYFSGLANAGCLADCQRHILGNECDGYFYAGNLWMHSYALLASCPAPVPLSFSPATYDEAFRKTLQNNLASVNQRGEVTFGYDTGNEFPELPMMSIIGLEAHLLYSGDLSFAKQHLEVIDRIDAYLRTWLKDDLFFAPKDRMKGPNAGLNGWYYDIVIGAHGYTMYHNVNYVRTLKALETIYIALGREDKATGYRQLRESIVEAINRHLWDDNAYGEGKGGYNDWIHENGYEGRYFFACNQYPAILHGVAGPARSRRLLTTADVRINELKQYYHYTREGTLDNLWPLKKEDLILLPLRFGDNQNGGMLLAMTFWEVTARCKAGDVDGAYTLLKNFSEHARRTNWFEGVNGFGMDGMPIGWEGDPFLADQLVAAASVVHGFLGLEYSWDDFTVTPHLPSCWDNISATIMFKGAPYTILATNTGHVRIDRAT